MTKKFTVKYKGEDSPVDDMFISHDMCNDAVRGLLYGFTWDKTKEGTDFWHYVHLRLVEITKKGRG